MRDFTILITLSGAISLLGGCSNLQLSDLEPDPIHSGDLARMYEGLGDKHYPVTTQFQEAQAYFNQGMTWAWAFNHDEATRSFARAAHIDPTCAMAWWGVAYTEGPNYNDSSPDARREKAAFDAIQRALTELDNETPKEAAMINALAKRYDGKYRDDRKRLNKKYAHSMGEVWRTYNDDPTIGTLYADAMMNLRPWDLYTIDREPHEDTPQIVDVLAHVLAIDPYQPGANHLMIHAVEPSTNPDRGILAANRLSDLVPGSGHLRHMPSHIYVQTGMWQRSIDQNTLAIAQDRKYISEAPPQTIQVGYMIHNANMLAFSAMMVGQEQVAMNAAHRMCEILPECHEAGVRMGDEEGPTLDSVMEDLALYLDGYHRSVYEVHRRFGRWDEMIAEPAPPSVFPVSTATWHANRSVAFAAKKDFKNATAELDSFRAAVQDVPTHLPLYADDQIETMLKVADYFAAGELALQQGKWEKAADLLARGAEVEDELNYGEPPHWLMPIRHPLGAVYMKMGRYEDAERVYREDLGKWRDNGWSLYGLSRALEEQGKKSEALRVRSRYKEVWSKAEEETETSCKCVPKT
jgi:tetratricopeptide (TPR) repeat protein